MVSTRTLVGMSVGLNQAQLVNQMESTLRRQNTNSRKHKKTSKIGKKWANSYSIYWFWETFLFLISCSFCALMTLCNQIKGINTVVG